LAPVSIGDGPGVKEGLKEMLRALRALQEWLALRARLREEHQFHLERAAADFRSLGLARRAAKRKARRRFGGRRNLRIALSELGGDLPGLAELLRVHRAFASAWLQPTVLLAVTVLVVALSPAPIAVLEGVIGRPLTSEDRGAVLLSTRTLNPTSMGITPAEFEALRSIPALTGVERYQTIDARAHAAHGATLAAIQSEVRAKTGNRRFWAAPLPDRADILMEPAKVVWWFIAFYAVFSLRAYVPQFGKGRWLLYGFGVLFLHALATTTAWALAAQNWDRTPMSDTGAAGIFLLVVGFFGMTGIQYRYWKRDLMQRCPICLDRLLLPLTEGTPDGVLITPATTQSVCAHGHCVLVENRWSRRFRAQESPLQALVHF
jgi:hypothetical protein